MLLHCGLAIVRCEARRPPRAAPAKRAPSFAIAATRSSWTNSPSSAAGKQQSVQTELPPHARPRLSRGSCVVAAASQARGSCSRNLLVVGPGVLGSLVCQRWLNIFPAATVMGQTNTESAHERLLSLGVMPRMKSGAGDEQFPFVVFSAPPSGSDDYAAEVEAALRMWDGTGAFVFTSSTAVYSGTEGELCDETTPQFEMGASPRADTLLKAEAAVLGANGCVVRLSGLYHSQRGAHMYFLKTPVLASRPDALVNLVHYEDAAKACVDSLTAQFEGRISGGEIFLATDGVPVTRQEMVESCLTCAAYDEGAMPQFTVEDGPRGKSMTNLHTRDRLGWEPVYPSFTAFVAAGAVDSFFPKRKVNRW
eukprot:CAMPEP_0181355388 /NCGR_PEP_ID=MMETSP1106-20121128/3871_1 /TAXON_ID=81844 /ORGANISM="Mantoniella antarctica, Strain SL-175" /LENGTH=364 /DNA_ID=CAMNT_0023468121 /DNA_START=91 /DNA_END=1182 /DNA_ORIENTATION=+